jgi:hypothetical protein
MVSPKITAVIRRNIAAVCPQFIGFPVMSVSGGV